MNKKIITIFIVLVIITNVICVPISKAGLVDNARSEQPNTSADQNQEDTPSNSTTTTTTTETKTEETRIIPYWDAIEGNVYEDLGIDTTVSTLKDIPIEGVLVELYKGENLVETQRSDSNGSYLFTNLNDKYGEGTYSIKYKYGYLDDSIDYTDVEYVKEILKYNGQDYIATDITGENTSVETINIIEQKIKISKSAATQIYLTLDCSVSTYETTIEYNGVETTLIKAEIDATKKLVNQLLGDSYGIYIGLIIFDGEATRTISLTDNEEYLIEALDSLEDRESIAWTNIQKALLKANNSFLSDEANKIVVLISDCIPTKSNKTTLSADYSDEEMIYYLVNNIGPDTKEALKKLKNNDVKVITLTIDQQDDPQTDEYVKSIFNEDTVTKIIYVDNDEEVVKTIEEDLEEEILQTIENEERSYTNKNVVGINSGNENEERREEVDNNYNTFYYDNTIEFSIIENYSGTQEEFEEAKQLSQKIYMVVDGGDNYEIISKGTDYEVIETRYDENDEPYEYTIKYKWTAQTYSGECLYLGLRAAPELYIESTITDFCVVLQTGSILTRVTQNIGSTNPSIISMDDELMYGSSIEVEYTIHIVNTGSIQYNSLSLVNYLPEGLTYMESVTCSKEVNAYEIVSIKDCYRKGFISEEAYTANKDKEVMIISFNNNGEGKNGFYLAAGGELDIKVKGVMLINDVEDLENIDFSNNETEVVTYASNISRRMMSTQAYVNTQIYPGNINEQDYTATTTNMAAVVPNTGTVQNIEDDRKYIIVISIITAALIVTKVFKIKMKNR